MSDTQPPTSHIEEQLQAIVERFNSEFRSWEESSKHGANFGFYYNSDGKKVLRVLDIAPVKAISTEDLLINKAGEIIKEALDRVGGD